MGPERTSRRDVRLTLSQRLGLAKAELPYRPRQHLALGRAGAALFAGQGTFGLAAALARGDLLGEQLPVLAAAVGAYALAAVIFAGYDVLGRLSSHLLAAAGTAIVTLLVLGQSDGVLWAWLYVLPVFFVAFFFRPRNAAVHVAGILLAFGAAMAVVETVHEALQTWILGAGPLIGAAALVVVLRHRLRRLVDSRARALQRERETRILLDAFFEHAPVAVSFLDRDLRYVRVNDAFAVACGVEPARAVGRTVADIWPEMAAEMEPLLRHVVETGQPTIGEELSGEAPPGSGRIHHWLISRYPVPGPDGKIAGVASIAVDVTELKGIETRLEELLAIEQATRLEVEISR